MPDTLREMRNMGECSAPRSRAPHRARILGLGLSASIAFALAGCAKPEPPVADRHGHHVMGSGEKFRVDQAPCDEDLYQSAALERLDIKMLVVSPFAFDSEIDTAREKIADERKRATGLKDPCWRQAYIGWLDYADQRANEAAVDLDKRRAIKKLLAENPPR